MSKKTEVVLKMSNDDEFVGYLYLPKHPKKVVPSIVKKTIAISDLIENYKGIPLYLDFDEDEELIGIEIVG